MAEPVSNAQPRATFRLNGTSCEGAEHDNLLDAVRIGAGLTGTKPGCGAGGCGLCTVLVDGVAREACTSIIADVAGRDVETIESVVGRVEAATVRAAFVRLDAGQCGWCLPAHVVLLSQLLASSSSSVDAERQLPDYLDRVLCRCGDYQRIRTAALAAIRDHFSPAVPA